LKEIPVERANVGTEGRHAKKSLFPTFAPHLTSSETRKEPCDMLETYLLNQHVSKAAVRVHMFQSRHIFYFFQVI